MSISTKYKNAAKAENFGMCVRKINSAAFIIEKDLDLAAEHLRYLLDHHDIGHITVAIENDETLEKNEPETWQRILREVPMRAPEKGQVIDLEAPTVEFEEAPKRSMGDAFKALTSFVQCVAGKHSNGLFIAGPGGTGKTWTVMEAVKAMGLKEDSNYIIIKGYSTPMGLYMTLFENLDKLIIFDDCDSIFKDLIGLNILKAVLDTYPTRKVGWNSMKLPEEVPPFFNFTGQIIFISNINPNTTKNDSFQAVMTRVLSVIVGGTKEEIRERIVELVPIIATKLSNDDREEIIEFVNSNYLQINDLNIRFLVHVVGLYEFEKANPDCGTTWQDLAWSMAA